MMVFVRSALLSGVAAVALAMQGSALAQATLSNLLGMVNVNPSSKAGSCSQIDIALNRPVNVTETTPAQKGMEITIRLEPLGTQQSSDSTSRLAEAATVPAQNPAGLGIVSYNPAGQTGPEIHLVFAKAMAYKLRRDENDRHIVLDVSDPSASASCLGIKTSDKQENTKSDLPQAFEGKGKITEDVPGSASSDDATAALAQGKKLLAAGDFSKAGAFFTKATNLGTGKVKQEALEMLGLAHERAGQLPFAKSEYESYLKQYPGGPEAARVEQRLKGVVAAMDDESSKKFEQHQAKLNGDVPASALTVTGPGKGNANVKLPGTTGVASVVGSSGSGGTVVTNLGLRTSLDQPPKDPKAWTISKAGSVAQYYYRDDNFVPSAPGGPLFGTHQTFQNQVLSSLDGYVRAENQDYAFEAHASAFNQVDLANLSTAPNLNLSTVYLDSKFKQENIGLRAGRQSKSTGGIFGRFDGVVATWEGWSGFKLQGAGGSPVLARDAMPFSNDRWFGSGSIEYTSPKKDWGAAIYAIEQNVGDLVDRRAIGGEARYSNEHFNVYSAADYDIFFHTLNNAYISGTWLPRQGMSIYGTIDYRKTPFLTASNALSGQPAIGSLQELANALGVDLTQCALDRTATSETASAGISNQFSDKWQGSLDVSVSQYLGTPPSPACSIANPNDFFTPDSGINVYASATLSGSSLFKQNDSLTTSLRMGYSPQSITYGVDASYRYPVNDKLRISPRAQVNFRKSLTSDQFQYMVGASLGASYRLNNHWTFESEAGLRYQNSISAGVSQPSLDFTISAGYRYEFD